MEPFGTYLRTQRKAHFLARAWLSERAGLAPEAVAALETNQRPPTPAEVRALARALRLPEAEVLVHAGFVGRLDASRQDTR